MSAEIKIKDTEIEYTNTDSNTGSLSFDTNENFNVNRPFFCTQGISTSNIVVGDGGGFTLATNFSSLQVDSLLFKDNQGTPTAITIEAPATVSSAFTLTLPDADGSQNSVLKTDGSGNLGWTALSTLVPPGVIMPYSATSAPSGYLVCNGDAVSRSTYANLFAVVGTTYGTGDGSSTFNVPDMRGRFLRGLDGGVGRDPDRASRTGGDAIGSTQSHQYASHTHAYGEEHRSGTTSVDTENEGWPYNAGFNSNANTGYAFSWRTSNASGGNETRPININVVYIIKT